MWHLKYIEGAMSDYSYFCDIDLATNHFNLHAKDQNSKVIHHKSVTHSKLLTTIANMPLIRIDVEACGGAHYWARTLSQLGHDASIMAVKCVITYRTKGKNDLNDVVSICEAVQRPSILFGSVNPSINKQDKLSQWCRGILERRRIKRAIVALAAKNARIIWSLLHNQTEYENYAA